MSEEPPKKVKGFLRAVRPSGAGFKWIVFLLLIAVLYLGSQGQLEGLREFLDRPELTLEIERVKISPYGALKVVLLLVALVWIAAILNSAIGSYLERLSALHASNRQLLAKVLQIIIYVAIFFIAMDALGVDLTALTIFSGAIGIGIGFGLQKIASNFISGLILLFERSIEVGDLVELDDGTAGFIRKTGGRYTLVETFDTKEVLIPNEDFITSRVTNWTYSNSQGRIDIPIGVAYGSDYKLVRDCILEAAREDPQTSDDPEPVCFMTAFGNSSVDFLLFFWVDDIKTGRLKPRSDVMFAITDKFRENGITIPFPQRDVHMKD